MQRDLLSCGRKALAINQDQRFYGTLAEIGAGQEVARHFFQAGLASKGIAKTMSAYDMTFSDSIYGKGTRYVSKDRVRSILDHEFQLLQERLAPTRGATTCFFTFADTVATSSKKSGYHNHGWLGVRFQVVPEGPFNDVVIHVELLDQNRLQQQEVLGLLGVNLLYACMFHLQNPELFLESLTDNIGGNRIEIDYVRFEGQQTRHIDNRIVAVTMIQKHLTHAAIFGVFGDVEQPADFLWSQNILVQRGAFRPVTTTNMSIMENAMGQFKQVSGDKDPLSLLEISMNSLTEGGRIDEKDFLDRVDAINAVGQRVMISDFGYFYELKEFLRRCTSKDVGIVIGAGLLPKLFDPSVYRSEEAGILQAFGRLFDDHTHLYVFPYKSGEVCDTAGTYNAGGDLNHLFQYLYKSKKISDIIDCDDVDTSIHSSDVRKMLKEGNSAWKELVPPQVKDLILQKKLFGYRG